MEKRDLSFKNFISIFFKNLTFDKISEDDFNDNKTNYKKSETDSFKGGKYDYNNDILKLKLEIPNTITSQFDDLESKFNDIVKESDKLIPEIQKQLNKRKNNYLIYGGVNEINDKLDFLPQQIVYDNDLDLQTNNNSITQEHLDSNLVMSNIDSINEPEEPIENYSDNEEYKQDNIIIEDSDDKEDLIDIDDDYSEIITHDDIEKQLTELYKPIEDQIENDSDNDLELNKKIVLLSNDLDPSYEYSLKDYEDSEQTEIKTEDKVLIGGIEKINLSVDNNSNYDGNNFTMSDDNVLESLSDIKKIDADFNYDNVDANINDSESFNAIFGDNEVYNNNNDYDAIVGGGEVYDNINNNNDYDAIVGGGEVYDNINNNNNDYDAIVGGGEIYDNINNNDDEFDDNINDNNDYDEFDDNINDNNDYDAIVGGEIDTNGNDIENDNESLNQLTNSVDPDYAKEIITNVIEDQQNENRKIRFGF